KHCGGDGAVRSESNFKIKIPAGIDNGQSIRLQGKGEHNGGGGSAGDLYVVIHVRPDKRFARDGNDIFTEVKISYPQAALGAEVEIDTVDGRKKLVIPEGTQPNQQIRLKGRGIPHLQGGGRGDQYVKVIVEVPKRIGRKARGLLQDLAKEL
ncbi:MAG: DnaJ C-terminal domain-containing protein, partial [Patescibacteria group bacterium]